MLGPVTRYGLPSMARPARPAFPVMRAAPRQLQRAPPAPPGGWGTQQRAGYYFDAGWHSAQSLRRLIRANLAATDLGLCPPGELLTHTVETLLTSICPGLPDDGASLAQFRRLLAEHLGGLAPAELTQLQAQLQAQHFDCVVSETFIDDPMFEKFGCSNGPPNQRMRTLMQTAQLHDAIQGIAQAGERELQQLTGPRLSAAEAAAARAALAALATAHTGLAAASQTAPHSISHSTSQSPAPAHADASITLDSLVAATAQLAAALGLADAPVAAIAMTPLPPASSVAWQGTHLLVDLHTYAALRATGDRELHAGLLRDLLELLLARQLFGAQTELPALSSAQRSLLFREVEQVLSAPQPAGDPAQRQAARRTACALLKRRSSFGTVQIFPTAGVKLGHASIAPLLSLIPDRSVRPRPVGTRFMRPGFRLEPAHCPVSEWDLRWLDAQQSEALYPAKYAWHLRVPAQRARLQQAAAEIMDDWRRKALPYRFIGTEPGMPPTGCRATVWQAVQQAMDDDTRLLFEQFRRGLPAPDSPTELALRLEQFSDWLTALAAQPEAPDL